MFEAQNILIQPGLKRLEFQNLLLLLLLIIMFADPLKDMDSIIDDAQKYCFIILLTKCHVPLMTFNIDPERNTAYLYL